MTDRTTHVAANQDRANTKKVFVKTYGCQMNVYDSQRMADALGKQGFVVPQVFLGWGHGCAFWPFLDFVLEFICSDF